MQKSYIDYAMSVIIARALPDFRDGLKPVQRRTLYDMSALGIYSDRPYRKSARIVGDTMGKYHPHGDTSIYDCLVVMAQDFKKALPLVDGHGNFGNIEGDGAAAMRYTEARLQKITEEAFLSDLDKDVVDFVPNFDETEKEPSVLPVRIPHFLINGSEGIAVGMATSTPPHNLGEVIDAEIALLDDPDLTDADLMRFIPGPDFPTGGEVVNKDDLKEIYETGTGRIKIRGKVGIEKGKAGRTNVVITEIPYTMIGAGIGKFLSDVAQLSESKLTQDIVDITNQSSQEGIRIVIELRRDANAENFKNLLYKKTRLEDTFGVNMLGILNGKPETLGLKDILKASIDFQYETNRRKYTNLLKHEQDKREVQEGLIKACNVIDLIIEILRGSTDRAMAKKCLVEGETAGIRFRSRESEIMASQLLFTERQADAILEMRLYRLIGLEINALLKEHEQTVANIYRYEDILEEKSSMTQVIRQELLTFRKNYAVPRKTLIRQAEEAKFTVEAPKEHDVLFVMDRFGYAKLLDASSLERNKEAIETEYRFYFICKSSGKICLFTDKGNLHTFKVSDLPEVRLRDKGVPVDNISNFSSASEHVILAASQKDLNLYRLMFASRNGFVKMVDGGEFDVTRKTVTATKLADDDLLAAVAVNTGAAYLVMRTAQGYMLKVRAEDIPVMKKTAAGVHGIKLVKGDELDSAWLTGDNNNSVVMIKDSPFDTAGLKTAGRGTRGSKIRI
ncbi:MAG: DNA topoisomerase 4 subunit A [Lachnospiraceae bacterium]|nr:DNA topoisomerase 4 subunit A [Lachnospiraceae bacterium]